MAQRGVNKAILIGNVGHDPEVRYLPGGEAVANLSLATSEAWKDKATGELQERTEWHRVAVFGKVAELVKQYVHKGSKLYVEGKLRTRKWQGQDGQDRYSTEVVVDLGGTIQFLDSKPAGAAPQQPASRGAPPAAGKAPPGADGPTPDFDDDIPF